MSYATLVEFKARVGTRTSPPGLYEQMTDRVAATTASDSIGQVLLDDAAAIVNQKLARRYAVPVDVSADATLAAFLRRCVLVIATFNGWTEHPKLSSNRETVKTLYDETMKMLDAIASGAQEIPAVSPPTGTTAAGSPGTAIGNTRIFTEDAMKGL